MSDHRPLLFISSPCGLTAPALEAAVKAASLGWAPIVVSYTCGTPATDAEIRCELARSCDAFYLVGRHDERTQAEESAFFFAHGNIAPIYYELPSNIYGRGPLVAPPFFAYGEAAERKTVEGWACKTCKRFWGSDERMARYCCVRELPCSTEGCGVMVKKGGWTTCSSCRSKYELERHAKRQRRPWNGLMLFSEAIDEWFSDLDAAEDHVRDEFVRPEEGDHNPTPEQLREGLEALRILQSKPVYGRPVEISEHLFDDMPDEGDEPDLSSLDAPVEALNKAIEALGPLHYEHTNVAVDFDAAPVLSSEASHGS